ncbi:MAG TPA: RNA 2',3'-cyclic phosphodiesterase [Gemmatimonadaceae bacterium]
MDQMVPERLFIGVPLTEDARRAIAASLPQTLPGKPVPPGNWHFTLRFLGATSAETRGQIVTRLQVARCGAAFTVRFGQLGAFPNPRRARILWLGIEEGSERLTQLAALAEGAARSVGFAAEDRPFSPHLTLSRINPPQSINDILSGSPRLLVEMPVHAIVLYRSRLGGGPARYEEVERFELNQPA